MKPSPPLLTWPGAPPWLEDDDPVPVVAPPATGPPPPGGKPVPVPPVDAPDCPTAGPPGPFASSTEPVHASRRPVHASANVSPQLDATSREKRALVVGYATPLSDRRARPLFNF